MPTAATEAAPLHYVESSAVLSALLELSADLRRILRAAPILVTSALTVAECFRAIRRGRQSGRLSMEQERLATRAVQSFLDRCDLIAVTESVLLRAGRPFPAEPIRTLDAIHLASVEALNEDPALVTVITRDARIVTNARAMGYATA
jgi:predicted nucleic acid-binding protein